MKSFVQANLGEYAPIATNALSAMQSAMNAVMALIHGDWQGFLTNMDAAMSLFWTAIQGATSVAFTILQESFTGSMNAIKGTLQSACDGMQSIWQGFSDFMSSAISGFQGAVSSASSWLSSTLSGMEAAASSAASWISSTISSAWSQVETSTKDLTDKMYKHSIWPDMLAAMQSQTEEALGNIVGEFQGAFGNVALSVPAMGAIREPAASAAPAFASQSITIPITVTLDGQVIAKTVKKTLIEQRQYHERSVGRLT